jgi:hypothetical protein
MEDPISVGPRIRGIMLNQLWVFFEGLTCFFFSSDWLFPGTPQCCPYTTWGPVMHVFELVMDTRYKPKTCTTWVQSAWITRKKEADSTLVQISLGMGDPDNKAVDLRILTKLSNMRSTDRNRIKVLQCLLTFIAVFKGLVCLLWVLNMRKNQKKPETYVSFVTICSLGFLYWIHFPLWVLQMVG